jgi:hypothetical protein
VSSWCSNFGGLLFLLFSVSIFSLFTSLSILSFQFVFLRSLRILVFWKAIQIVLLVSQSIQIGKTFWDCNSLSIVVAVCLQITSFLRLFKCNSCLVKYSLFWSILIIVTWVLSFIYLHNFLLNFLTSLFIFEVSEWL